MTTLAQGESSYTDFLLPEVNGWNTIETGMMGWDEVKV